MPMDFSKCHGVLPCSFPYLQHHSCLEIQTINIIKCPANVALQVTINNSYIHPDLRIMLTFTRGGICKLLRGRDLITESLYVTLFDVLSA